MSEKRRIVVFWGLVLLFVAQSAGAAEQRPNIVFILADDLGYGDLGCYGHPQARTPNIDLLARRGVRFTQHYANGPECSPTRTAFLTGRYQQRVGGLECAIGTGNVGRYDDAIRLANQRDLGLPVASAIIPGELKKQGYACGVFGKWHLGYEPKFNPARHGWDAFFGYLGGNVHYFNHRELSDLHVLFRDDLPVHRSGYMTHLITTDSLEFLRQHQKRPFFLYVSHECPHFPFQGPGDTDKLITEENWTTPDADTYVAMLEDLDTQVGHLLRALDELKLTQKTLVVFVSDNGGYGKIAHMGPLRGAKGTTLEGGIRVPLIVSWPGKIRAGQESHQVCATFDLTYSFLRLAGVDVTSASLDGMDVIQHLTSEAKDVPRTLYWRGKRGDRVWSAVRDGNLKLVTKQEAGVYEEWLYNVHTDIGEANDIQAQQPQESTRLKQLLSKWERDVKASR